MGVEKFGVWAGSFWLWFGFRLCVVSMLLKLTVQAMVWAGWFFVCLMMLTAL